VTGLLALARLPTKAPARWRIPPPLRTTFVRPRLPSTVTPSPVRPKQLGIFFEVHSCLSLVSCIKRLVRSSYDRKSASIGFCCETNPDRMGAASQQPSEIRTQDAVLCVKKAKFDMKNNPKDLSDSRGNHGSLPELSLWSVYEVLQLTKVDPPGPPAELKASQILVLAGGAGR
jgi:hypothetical protein